MKVVIFFGGRSGEHDISLISAAAIARNISDKHEVTLIGITKNGVFYRQSAELLKKVRAGEALAIDENQDNLITFAPGLGARSLQTFGKPLFNDGDEVVLFPVLHGTFGEDGSPQGLFEMAGVPYVGCGVLSSALSMDKDIAKTVVKAGGVNVAPGFCMTRAALNDKNIYDKIFIEAESRLPLFIKPCNGGSSNGATRASTPKELSYALMEAFMWDDKVLIEKALDAREIECAVTGDGVTGEVCAYELGEIRVQKKNDNQSKESGDKNKEKTRGSSHDFYDFDAKYNDKDGAQLDVPAKISPEKKSEIIALAKKVYTLLGASGMSRVDFLMDKKSEVVYFNEINSIPGFTQISMFPKLCECAGLGFSDLIDKLLKDALDRYDAKKALRTQR